MCKIQGKTVCTCGSTREVLDHLDTIKPKYAKELLVGPPVVRENDLYDDDDITSQSPESSCVSAQDYWETGGESDLREEEEEEEEEGGRGGGDHHQDAHEERRLSERSFPRSYPQTSRRTRRRTKKRHASPQRYQSSTEEERSSCLRNLASEDEEPTRYDPNPSDVVCSQPSPSSPVTREPSLGLSELLSHGEPVVASHLGSWAMRGQALDANHRTAPIYNRFDDDVSQGSWYRSDEDDLVVSPRVSGDYSEAPPGPGDHQGDYKGGQSAVKVLMRNINSIKRKIKRYEEEFESAFGYRPSHSEKMKHREMKKYMSELSKARKELKQMKDDVAGLMSGPTVFPLSLLRCQESTEPTKPANNILTPTNNANRPTNNASTPSNNAKTPINAAKTPGNVSATAETIRQVEDRLREKRSASGRPMELKNMSKSEMQEEKTALQKALLYYESVHGRPTTREDRDLARPLYDRYRQVKRIVVRTSSRNKESMAELAPILEHVAMDFTLASPQHRGSLHSDDMENVSLPPSPPSTPPVFEDETPEAPQTAIDEGRSVALGDLHALPLSELRERKKEARDEKKRLRRALRDFEEIFERDFGRKVQKEDRGPMEQTYLDYKHAKAKLRLLEALLSKHEPHKV